MKEVNVAGMLRKITWKQFQTWLAFDMIEPIGGVRHDHLTASIIAMMANLRRDVERFPTPWPYTDFLLRWGEAEQPMQPVKKVYPTWQQLKLQGQMLAALYNAAENEHEQRRGRRRKKSNG